MRPTEPRRPALAARDLYKNYGRRAVLRGARFEAWPGELVAVLGENGGGKSTLLRILAGTMRADRGSVVRGGAMGYCPQDCLLYPHLTPDEHLALFGRGYGLTPATTRVRADALAGTFGFERDRGRVVNELSGGTRQKVSLSIALLHDPPVLLLDEPYAGFDVETYERFVAYSREATSRGVCIVLVTHIAFERDRFDQRLHLREGILHAETR